MLLNEGEIFYQNESLNEKSAPPILNLIIFHFFFHAFYILTLKAPIRTAADDIRKYFFIVFQRKKDLVFQVNLLLDR